MSITSRKLTSEDRIPLYRIYGHMYEWTSGMASKGIRDGDVTINGVVITDDKFLVKDGDKICESKGKEYVIEIPSYWRQSCNTK